MLAELHYFFTVVVAIFVIVDPFALVPVYLSLTERFTDTERRTIRRKATLIALGILVTFAITGLSIFNVFSITLPAFKIAGGILLLNFGISTLNSKRERVTRGEHDEGMEREDISIFPLATPLLAGPGAISTVVLMSTQAQGPGRVAELILAIVIVLAISHLFLRAAPLIFRVLGRTGLNLITRIMGIILTAIAVQFIINGIKETFF